MIQVIEVERHGPVAMTYDVFAWDWPAGRTVVDVTVQFSVDLKDGGSPVPIWFHTAADNVENLWRVRDVQTDTVQQLLEQSTLDPNRTLRESLDGKNLFHANWLVKPVPQTTHHRWVGAAREQLDRDLNLQSDDRMQDWPLEVSNSRRLDDYCEYYDELKNDDAKLDCMSLCLFAWRGSNRVDLEPWFETCLLYTSPSPRDLSTSRMPSSA